LLADNSTHLSQFFANILAIFYKFFCEFLAKMTMKNKSHVSPTFVMALPFRRFWNTSAIGGSTYIWPWCTCLWCISQSHSSKSKPRSSCHYLAIDRFASRMGKSPRS